MTHVSEIKLTASANSNTLFLLCSDICNQHWQEPEKHKHKEGYGCIQWLWDTSPFYIQKIIHVYTQRTRCGNRDPIKPHGHSFILTILSNWMTCGILPWRYIVTCFHLHKQFKHPTCLVPRCPLRFCFVAAFVTCTCKLAELSRSHGKPACSHWF